MGDNPRRDWDARSYPTQPNKRTVRDPDTEGCWPFTLMVVGVFVAGVLALVSLL